MIPGGMLGPVGGLEQVWFTSKESMSKGSRFVTRTALSGRSHAQVLPRQARTWACEIPHDAPQEGHALDQLETWVAHQREPLVWYPADALGTNMLDPGASQMDTEWWEDVESGGARVQPGDGLPGPRFLSSASTSPTGKWAHLSDVPVPHNVELTASVYVTPYLGQVAHFWVDELRMDGSTHTVHKANTVVANATNAAASTLHRLSHTITTTGETAAITFGVSRASAVVAPALTLTDHVREWGIGRGCMSALVDVTGRSPLWTATNQHIYGSADATSFTITELIA